MAHFKHHGPSYTLPSRTPDLSEIPSAGTAEFILQQPPPPRPPQLVPGLFDRAGVGFVLAPPYSGKTTFALNIAIAVAAGAPVLANPEWQTERAEVLFISLDHGVDPLRHRMETITKNREIAPPSRVHFYTDWWPFHEPAGHSALAKFLADNPAVRLVVIDPLPPIPSQLTTGAIDGLRLVAETRNVFILINRHITRLAAAFRYNTYHRPDDLHIALYPGSLQTARIRTAQRNISSRVYDLQYNEDAITATPVSPDGATDAPDQIFQAIRAGASTTGEIAAHLNISRNSCSCRLYRLKVQGRLIHENNRYRIPQEAPSA